MYLRLPPAAVVRLAAVTGPAVAGLVALATGAAQAGAPLCGSDSALFAPAGQALAGGHLSAVYADPANQGGPLELLWAHLSTVRTAGCLAAPRSQWLFLLLAVAVTLAAVAVFRSVTRAVFGPAGDGALPVWQQVTARAAADVAGCVFAAAVLPLVFRYGHPADVLIPLAWLAAARAAATGRTLTAGLLVGAATGWETWALLGVSVLLLTPGSCAGTGAPRSRRRAVGAGTAAAAGVAACWYLPFALSGRFAMGSMSWPMWPHTLVGTLTGGYEETWTLRLLQAVVAAGAGAAICARLRGTPCAVWSGPLTVIVVRLFTDPTFYRYYWAIPATLAVAAAGATLTTAITAVVTRHAGGGQAANPGTGRWSLVAALTGCVAAVAGVAVMHGRIAPGAYGPLTLALAGLVLLAAAGAGTRWLGPQ